MNESLSNSLGRLARRLLSSRDGSADVGEDTSLSNSSVVQQFVEFLVVSDGQKNVSGDNSGLFVVLGGVSCQLQHLSSEVFEDSCQIDGGSGTDSLGVVSVSKETSDSADGELKSCSGGLRDSLG